MMTKKAVAFNVTVFLLFLAASAWADSPGVTPAPGAGERLRTFWDWLWNKSSPMTPEGNKPAPDPAPTSRPIRDNDRQAGGGNSMDPEGEDTKTSAVSLPHIGDQEFSELSEKYPEIHLDKTLSTEARDSIRRIFNVFGGRRVDAQDMSRFRDLRRELAGHQAYSGFVDDFFTILRRFLPDLDSRFPE
jgi:hypothetical protein